MKLITIPSDLFFLHGPWKIDCGRSQTNEKDLRKISENSYRVILMVETNVNYFTDLEPANNQPD